jgi:hypothetical protein
MNIRLKIGYSNYLLSGNNPKLIEFAGMFFSPDIKIEKIETTYIDVDEKNSREMSVADLKAIKLYCDEANISTFQHYETTEPIGISMADEALKAITPIQEGLEKLIKKAVNRPKEVKSA